MKKIFVILAIVVLASAFSFAADDWGSGDKTGIYSASVFCTPTLVASTGLTDGALGWYFDEHNGNVTTPKTLEWTLRGPKESTYAFSFTGVATTGTLPHPVLKGEIYFTNFVSGKHIYGPAEQVIPPSTITFENQSGNILEIDCAKPFKFGCTVKKIDCNLDGINRAGLGQHTWTMTFQATATI